MLIKNKKRNLYNMRIAISALVVMISFSIYGQNFSGKAIYKTSRKTSFNVKTGNPGMDDKMAEEIKKKIQKMNQRTFELIFDKNTSTYKEKAKLAAPNPKARDGGAMVMSFGTGVGSTLYKNLSEKRYVNETELLSKRFLIKDTLTNYNWKLSAETKNIGNYTCYKATFTREVENVKMSFVNGEAKEEKKMETIVTTAWYTPQVPVGNGPANWQGLPGLILEINDGRSLIVCTEVILNNGERLSLEEPSKGKVVTQAAYEKISREKTKEMMERFKSRKGGGMKIQLGG